MSMVNTLSISLLIIFSITSALYLCGNIFLLFAVAFTLAYLFQPLIKFGINKVGFSVNTTITLVISLIFGSIIIGSLILIPIFYQQFLLLIEQLKQYQDQIK